MDRWKTLDQAVRARLAVSFLEKLGEEVPSAADDRHLNRELYTRLQQLAGEPPR